MQPTPLTTSLPKLAAMIDDERPLISAALLDVVVTDIGDAIVQAEVTTEHNFEILTMPSQHEYLNKALSRHWDKNAAFSLTLRTPAEAPMPQAPSPTPGTAIQLPPGMSLQEWHNQQQMQKIASPSPTPGPKRTANTLTFTERANLQHWMEVTENTAYVANESDALAAGKATGDLEMDITAGNIAGMRRILGIEKVKPAKPAPTASPHDIDLVALQAQVQQHHLQLDPIAGVNIAEVLSNLRNSLHEIKERVERLNGLDQAVLELRGPLERHEQRIKSLEASND